MLLQDVNMRMSYVITIRETLTYLVNLLVKTLGSEEATNEVIEMRGYRDIRMQEYLHSKSIIKMPSISDIQFLMRLQGIEPTPTLLRNLGLVGDSGGYWLQDRYAIPLRDTLNRVVALICWYPDARKYITTGTLGFTNTATFFNMESFVNSEGKIPDKPDKTVAFVVEGIFDALSIASLGYCALGNQGLALPPVKREMLSRFDEVYFIPDNDEPGRASIKYLHPRSSHKWDIPNGHIIQLETKPDKSGIEPEDAPKKPKVKDMDDFIKCYQPENLDFMLTQENWLRISL